MPEISVLLPTIRPHLVSRALSCVSSAARGVPHEVVVVADFENPGISDFWLTWIVRPRRGVVNAANTAALAARGRFIFLFNDESVMDPECLTRLYERASVDHDALHHPLHLPEFDFRYYGVPFAPFVFAHRTLLAQLGGLLDPAYVSFYADPDLGMRAHAAGVRVITVKEAVLRHCNEHDDAHRQLVNENLLRDRATFRARWDHLGEFKDP